MAFSKFHFIFPVVNHHQSVCIRIIDPSMRDFYRYDNFSFEVEFESVYRQVFRLFLKHKNRILAIYRQQLDFGRQEYYWTVIQNPNADRHQCPRSRFSGPCNWCRLSMTVLHYLAFRFGISLLNIFLDSQLGLKRFNTSRLLCLTALPRTMVTQEIHFGIELRRLTNKGIRTTRDITVNY